jgi:hypothetical protein
MSSANDPVEIQFELLRREGLFVDSCLAFGLTQLAKSPSKEYEGYILTGLMGTAQGVERLLKLAHVVMHFEDHQIFPSSNKIKNFGHNIENLLTNCRESKRGSMLDWSETDKPIAKRFIWVLTEYGSGKRYSNFDHLQEATMSGSPSADWLNLLALVGSDGHVGRRLRRSGVQMQILAKLYEGKVIGNHSDLQGRLGSHEQGLMERQLMGIATPEVLASLILGLQPVLRILDEASLACRERNGGSMCVPFFSEVFAHFVDQPRRELRRRKNWFYR